MFTKNSYKILNIFSVKQHLYLAGRESKQFQSEDSAIFIKDI